MTASCFWQSWWGVEKLNHTTDTSVFRCERDTYIYAVIKSVCTCTRAGLPVLSPYHHHLCHRCQPVCRGKRRKRLLTNDKQTDPSDKIRERRTTATKIDWQRVYNNASGLCEPINHAILGDLSRFLSCRGGHCNFVDAVIGWSSQLVTRIIVALHKKRG